MKRITTGLIMGWLVLSAGRAGAAETYDQAMRDAGRYTQLNEFEQAAQTCERAAALSTSSGQKLEALRWAGWNYLRAGKPDRARAVLTGALQQSGQKPAYAVVACLESLGDSYMLEREYREARKEYEQILKVEKANPGSYAVGWAKIGEAEYALGRYEEARRAYEEAVAIPSAHPNNLQEVWPGIGHCYMAEGKCPEARQAYARAMAAANADERIRLRAEVGIGHSYYEEGDYPSAAKVYLQVYRKARAPDILRIVERLDTIYRKQLDRADALLTAGKYADARREYEKVLTMEQVEEHHQASAEIGIGNALAGEKKYAEARTAYERALGMKGAYWPDKGRAQMGIARCYEAEGKATEAKQAYGKVIGMKNVSRFDVAAAKERQ